MSDVPTIPATPVAPPNEDAKFERLRADCDAMRREIERVYIGPSETIDSLLIALLARGHVLLEGVPGVAKTTLVRAFADTLKVGYRRIQFTPDLMPSDITGVYVPDLQTQTFTLRRGPIFANVVLGDEINRAPAKTQSALLEAMQEGQVTIEGERHALEEPFIVLATQNPLEQRGVYALPEAQLDRFLMKVRVGYPTADQEFRVLSAHQRPGQRARAVLSGAQIARMRGACDEVRVADELVRYIIELARFSREHRGVELGASPRAALSLLRAAKVVAALEGRAYALPDDIRAVAERVLAHRIVVGPDARMSGSSGAQIVRQALAQVRYAPAGA